MARRMRARPNRYPPYSLYGDEGEENLTGEDLPAGSYDLKATAYKKDGDVLGTLKVSFTVTAGQPRNSRRSFPTLLPRAFPPSAAPSV